MANQQTVAAPSPSRSSSLHVNYTQPHPKLSPTSSLKDTAQQNQEQHPIISPQPSLTNGKISPSNSHLNVNYRNAINRSPSPIMTSPMNSIHLSPMASTDESRRPSKSRSVAVLYYSTQNGWQNKFGFGNLLHT